MPSDLVFVTGGTGFIGAHVVRELIASGYRVRALRHARAADPTSLSPTNVDGSILIEPGANVDGSILIEPGANVDGSTLVEPVKRAPNGIEWVAGDVLHAGDLVGAMQGCRYLVHCAALYSFAPRDRVAIPSVNVAGTTGILEAARIAGIERAVVTSSAATVGPARHGVPATEANTMTDSHASAYHRSKLEQERAAIAARVPAVLLLPTAPVGPGDHKPTPTGQLILNYARGRILARPSTGGFNLVAVEDVARAHVAALERGKARERYIVGAENLSFDQVWDLLAEVTHRPAPRWHVPYGIALSAAYVDELRCRLQPRAVPFAPIEGVRMSREFQYVDPSKAFRELGFRASPVRDALQRAVDWYREHGYVA